MMLRQAAALPRRFPPRGKYTHRRNTRDRVMCHLSHSSPTDRARRGPSKFTGSSTPIIRAMPEAMSQ